MKNFVTNNNVRVAAKKAGIPLWAIALHVGVSEPTLTRWLRVPLSIDRENAILTAIRELSMGGESRG